MTTTRWLIELRCSDEEAESGQAAGTGIRPIGVAPAVQIKEIVMGSCQMDRDQPSDHRREAIPAGNTSPPAIARTARRGFACAVTRPRDVECARQLLVPPVAALPKHGELSIAGAHRATYTLAKSDEQPHTDVIASAGCDSRCRGQRRAAVVPGPLDGDQRTRSVRSKRPFVPGPARAASGSRGSRSALAAD